MTITNTGWAKFPEFRPIQKQMVDEGSAALDSNRFLGIEGPTGSGKSLAAMSLAEDSSAEFSEENGGDAQMGRVVYCVSTKALAAQLMEDFEDDGLFKMEGKNNYPCVLPGREALGVTVDKAPCSTNGYPCGLKKRKKSDKGGCPYYDSLHRAIDERLVVTNYTYLLNMLNRSHTGFGEIDMLVCDEAHVLMGELEKYSTVVVGSREVKSVLGWDKLPFLPFVKPRTPAKEKLEQLREAKRTAQNWGKAATAQLRKLVEQYDEDVGDTKDEAEQEAFREKKMEAERLLTKMKVIADMEGEWACSRDKFTVTCAPVWPGALADDLLFRHVDKVILTSATFPESIMDQLQIAKGDRAYRTYESEFNVERNPIYITNWCRLNYKTTDREFESLVYMLDDLLDGREEVRTLIQSGSYRLSNRMFDATRHKDRIIQHGSGQFRPALDHFLNTPEEDGPILLSPSAVEGIDLHGDRCRCIIYLKFPFPDTRDLTVQARNILNDSYMMLDSMIRFEQGIGRGMRGKEDWCEVFIADGNWSWISAKVKDWGYGSKFFWDRLSARSSGFPDLEERFG